MITTLVVIVLKFTFSNFSKEEYQNKTYYFITDVIELQIEKSEVNSIKMDGNNEYPFLKPSDATPDVLGSFFNVKEEKPNIVFIVVEGLGSEFVGDRDYSGFTPYLNSIIPESLYWDNFLCNTGRTFGAIPSLIGSLPFGEKGFLEIEDTPTHVSLFSILKRMDIQHHFSQETNLVLIKKLIF
ncbi:hypothetical protein [Polaribacter ponticola]|uniref:Sulfatase N-terminal domain-containing protein n=1 Tax=Polaribacter ponticola TaxID=2978475 RepID=A0ABT5S8P7_9FLAO|nr:hypothetical protein [Polaribacter sp. MSW5]MDD7914481.1 hypothetical protein [Polaribacter sp. MSW5]